MKRSVIALFTLFVIAGAAFGQNALTNPGFEVNPPGPFGNNSPYSIAPWVSSGTTNVVKVDGPGGTYNYGGNGPEFDATGTAPLQHYFDITSDGDVYQSFVARCSGAVRWGGSFSTRADASGNARISLLQGGATGTPIAPPIAVPLPAGNSATDPWKHVSGTASLVAGNTYTLFVYMDNSLNFDNGFVNYSDCPAPDPCCPPWNEHALQEMLVYKGTGGINAPYTLEFKPTPAFNFTQMQNYVDYLNSVNANITKLTIQFRLHDGGTGNTAVAGVQLGNSYYVTWTANTTTGGQPVPAFFSGAAETMQVNQWYVIRTGMYLEHNQTFFPFSCAENDVAVRVQVDPLALTPATTAQLQIRDGSGNVYTKPVRAMR